jgi:hypothetical protein
MKILSLNKVFNSLSLCFGIRFLICYQFRQIEYNVQLQLLSGEEQAEPFNM